jgi:hypothetical protein
VKPPSRETSDFGVAHRAEAALLIPKKAKKTRALKRVPHMIPLALLPSGPPPLLGASPLRTGLESFPSSGSSTRERPLEKRGRSRMQKSHTTYAILRGGRFTLPRNDPRQCGRLHQRFAPPSFAIASIVGSTTGLAFEHQREVGSVSGEVTQPLSAPLQGGLRFLPFPLPASPWSALRLSTSPEERYGLTLFRWTDAIV